MAALQYVDVPNYSAVIFRRTLNRLEHSEEGLIPRAINWLKPRGAEWNGTKRTFKFPSGAQLQFGHIKQEIDKHNYQGGGYQFIGFDELTEFTEGQYTFLFSRLSKLAGSDIPTRMRCTSNPGGEGHHWVKRRFIPREYAETPKSERFSKVWRIGDRVFVPSRLADNLAVDQADYIASMQNLDPVTREQYLEGNWETDGSAILRLDDILNCVSRDCLWPGGRMPEGESPELYLGVDLGMSKDRTVFWTWEKVGDIAWCRDIEVLDKVHLDVQEARLRTRINRHVVKCYIDKGFNPQIAQAMERDFPGVCEGVSMSGHNAGRFGTQFANAVECGKIRLPDSQELIDDFMLVTKVSMDQAGNAKLETARGSTGHADRFWAAAFGYHGFMWEPPPPKVALPRTYVPTRR